MKTKHFITAVPVMLFSLTAMAVKLEEKINLEWEVGYTREAGVAPLIWIPADRSQAAQVVKPAVSYGWDWHPRLVPLGIWDSTYLEIRPWAHVNDISIDYSFNEDLSQAGIGLGFYGINLKGKQFTWILNDLPQDVGGGKVTVRLSDGQNQVKVMDWNYERMDSNKNQQGPTIHYRLPAWKTDRFKLILEVENHPEYNSEYILAFRQ